MKFRTDRYYLTAAWLWILGFTLFRIVYAQLFLLAPDECNYWQWSRYLDWGYYDQAPTIAWVIKLSTVLFGHTHIGTCFLCTRKPAHRLDQPVDSPQCL